MKIYQIHEYGGEWEDKYDFIVASYLSKKKAIIEKERLEKEESELSKCNQCPLYVCPTDCDLDCGTEECKNYAIGFVKKNCKDYKPTNEESYPCGNYYHKMDDSFFKIEEVEVIE